MTPILLPLDQARPGQRLGSDLRDARGAVLLAAGSELSESLINALRRRGVESISVALADSITPEEQEMQREAARRRLAWLFRRAGESEAERQLFEALLDYRLERIG